MRPRTILLLVVAIGCGLVAAFMVNQIAGSSKSKDMVDILVPKGDIRQGQKIDVKTMFVSKPFPKESVPLKVVNDPGKLEGKVLSRTVNAGQFVTERELSNETMGIMREMEPGYRAMTVRANIESGLAGFLMPGSRVDIMTIVRDQENNLNESRIFLQNVKVLAVNVLADQPEGKATVGQVSSITLMLRPKDVERLFLVTARGQVGVVLRKPGDTVRAETKGATSPFVSEDDPDEGKSGGTPPVQLAYAIRDVKPGTPITKFDEYFRMVEVPKSRVFGNMVTSREDIEGKTLSRFLAEGQPASASNFLAEGAKLPEGPDTIHRMTIINGGRTDFFDFGGGGSGPRSTLPPGRKRDNAPPGEQPRNEGGSEARE